MRYLVLIAGIAAGVFFFGGQTLQSVKAKVLGVSASQSHWLATGNNGGWGN